MEQSVRAASVQFEHAPGDKQTNMKKMDTFLDAAVKKGVHIIVFPECCITGYWFLRKLSKKELLALAEPVFDGETSQKLSERAKHYNMTIGAGAEINLDGLGYRGNFGPGAATANLDVVTVRAQTKDCGRINLAQTQLNHNFLGPFCLSVQNYRIMQLYLINDN